MTGPTPKISVRVVPDAWTAAVSLFLASRIWASMRRRSSRKPSARSRRACPTAPDAVTCSRTRAACAAVILLETPPGTSPHSTACRRHTTWVRARPRSRCAFSPYLQHRGVVIGPDAAACVRAQRAIATERASLGSFLFVSPDASSRTRAPSLGWTSSTCSPAATSCWASRCPRPAAPSTAQVRCGQDAPTPAAVQPGPPRPGSVPGPAALPPRRSPPPCASPCAGPHRSSLPPPPAPFPVSLQVTAAGMPYFGSASHLFEPRRGETRQAAPR